VNDEEESSLLIFKIYMQTLYSIAKALIGEEKLVEIFTPKDMIALSEEYDEYIEQLSNPKQEEEVRSTLKRIIPSTIRTV
jgi:hypothetical protein